MALLTSLFWGSIAGLGYTYLGYPILLTAAAKLCPRPWMTADITPDVSLLIAAWNEAGVIEAKLKNALQLDYPSDRLEIIVASDGSTDDTASIARRFEARGVRVLELSRGGKTETLNRAMKAIQSEIVVFSDANVFFEPDALRKLIRHFADPAIGGVTGDVRLEKQGFTLGESQGIYYRYERFIQEMESRVGSIIGVDGGMYAIRREYFRPVPKELINDDFIISMEVVKQGARVIYDPEAIALEASPVDASNEFRRKIRVEHGNFQAFFSGYSVPSFRQPWMLFAYMSHKVIRWLGFVPLSVSLLSSLLLASQGGIFGVAALGQAGFYLAALQGARREGRSGRLGVIAHYFVLENLAAAAGLLRVFTGKRSWGTAETAHRSSPVE